jgi:phosphotransferase system HPr (HPr) family protein
VATTPGNEVLSTSEIVVGASADDRSQAIRQVGALLVAGGLVTEGYVDAMLSREEIISTYLGNGIALPHGTSESQDTILRTGLAVAQFPDGVPWGDEPARLVIGLAARSEEHIAVMSQLAAVLGDEELCARLASTTDPEEIHRVLMGSETPPQEAATVTSDDLHRAVRIANPHGLHARPAAEIVEGLMDFDADVTIVAGERHANGASITQLIALGATTGDEVTVSASGEDAQAAIDAVASVLLAETEGS